MGKRPARDVRQRVRHEREVARAWSYDDAGRAGQLSGETWRRYEIENDKAKPPSQLVRAGVARAFGWANDWPENPPPLESPSPAPTAATGPKSEGFDSSTVMKVAALLADRQHAQLDTLNETLARLTLLVAEWRDEWRLAQGSEPHPAERVFDAAP